MVGKPDDRADMRAETWRNYQQRRRRRDSCLSILTERENIDEKLNRQSNEMNTVAAALHVKKKKKHISTFASELGNLPYCFLLFQTCYFVDDNQTIDLW